MPKGINSFGELVHHIESYLEVLSIVTIIEEFAVLLQEMANLGVGAKLRLIYDDLGRHVSKGFSKTNFSRACNSDQLALLTECDWVAAGVSNDAILIAPLVELDILLLLLYLFCFGPIYLQFVLETLSCLLL